MDASKKFASILRDIESSQLNFYIAKTPFSATISLKSSFVKRFTTENAKDEAKDNNSEVMKKTDIKLEDRVKEVDLENASLRAKLQELEKKHSEKHEAVTEQFKIALVGGESTIAELREDLLKVKKEKHKLSENLKAEKEKSEGVIEKLKLVKSENDKIQNLVTDKDIIIDTKKSEIVSLNAEINSLGHLLVAASAELENHREKDEAIPKIEEKCKECDSVFLS